MDRLWESGYLESKQEKFRDFWRLRKMRSISCLQEFFLVGFYFRVIVFQVSLRSQTGQCS